ncbi:hypothetical protein J437_LFUL016345 [Ladona fulva]|uniref:Uncharacterized protein n=1 Tax=Ladona fulva TaxID=123851 RepID=A0A8K0KPD7_LADFU|nr:hypothetical protein J437_LFUL016345 [Ladona fulva]
MRSFLREISALQAENYSLERQLFSYQKSIAYAHSRGSTYPEDAEDTYARRGVGEGEEGRVAGGPRGRNRRRRRLCGGEGGEPEDEDDDEDYYDEGRAYSLGRNPLRELLSRLAALVCSFASIVHYQTGKQSGSSDRSGVGTTFIQECKKTDNQKLNSTEEPTMKDRIKKVDFLTLQDHFR